MTRVRTVAGVGVGMALLTVLAGCSSDTPDAALDLSTPISAASNTGTPGPSATKTTRITTAPAGSLFGGSAPVSVVSWWEKHPGVAPADLAERTLLLNKQGTGPQRFPGPDIRQYDRVLMVITCAEKAEYLVRLQVLDGLSIASTSGPSCGGPTLSSYTSPSLNVTERQTEVEVQVPEGIKYYVTFYGSAGQ